MCDLGYDDCALTATCPGLQQTAKQAFNAPLLAEVARAYVKLKQFGPAKETAEQALALDEGCVHVRVLLTGRHHLSSRG